MTTITLHGKPMKIVGKLPETDKKAPDFKLVTTDMTRKSLSDFKGENLILNIFPSVDTGTCATSVRNFNKRASSLKNTKVICISKDLPFAQDRFCGAEGIKNVIMLSDFVTGKFGKDYGLEIANSPMASLLSRCIVVIDKNGIVTYTEQVAELANEPNYEAALKAL